MQTIIEDFDPATRTVAVTFADGDVEHRRTVNACLTEAGDYDAEATAERVEDVARGVAAKIALGIIVPVQPEPEPEATPATIESSTAA